MNNLMKALKFARTHEVNNKVMENHSTVGEIKSFIETGIGIHAMLWKRVQLRILDQLNAKGYYMHAMTDDTVLDKELILLISMTLDDICCEKLPERFLD